MCLSFGFKMLAYVLRIPHHYLSDALHFPSAAFKQQGSSQFLYIASAPCTVLHSLSGLCLLLIRRAAGRGPSLTLSVLYTCIVPPPPKLAATISSLSVIIAASFIVNPK